MRRIIYPPKSPTFPLSTKDRWGEWLTPHRTPSLLRAIELLPNDYHASAAFIRSQRPREAGPALQFWGSPVARAHFMNAILLRRERTLTQVQLDMDVTGEKIYAYLPRWEVEFSLTRRDVRLEDADGQVFDGVIEARDYDTGVATIHLNGYDIRVPARFSTITRSTELVEDSDPEDEKERQRITMLYRTAERVQLDLVPYTVLSLLSGYTRRGVRQLFPETVRAYGGTRLVSLAEFAAVLPPAHWQMNLEEARRRASTCNCVFFDLESNSCGLGNLLPEADSFCEDREPSWATEPPAVSASEGRQAGRPASQMGGANRAPDCCLPG